MSDSCTSCWTTCNKRRDPYLKAWIDDIPITTVEKAVWEFDRKEKEFKPYKWGDLTINPNVTQDNIDLVFKNIKTQLKGHPSSNAQRILLYFVLIVHLPMLIVSTCLYYIAMKSDDTSRQQLANILYASIVVGSTSICILTSIYLKWRYLHNLKDRQTQIENLLFALNRGIFTRYYIRAVAGKYGAWIELKFLNPTTYMMRGAIHNSNRTLLYPYPRADDH